jgi:hypothetical protein
MSQSPLARSLFTSACVSGVVFSAAALPFAAFKSNIVDLELQNQSIYSAELQYLAAPYLAATGGVSAALGLGVFGLVGWRQSARRVAEAESARQEMLRSLTAHQAELERIKFSEARLRSQNLTAFLQPGVDGAALAPAPNGAEPYASAVVGMGSTASQPSFAAATAEVSQNVPTPVETLDSQKTFEALAQPRHESLENLLHQLHQISKQVEELRSGSNQVAA